MAKYVQPTFIVDSSATFLKQTAFDASVYLKGTTHISNPSTATGLPFALVVDSIGDKIPIKNIQLGSMSFSSASDYYTIQDVNASLGKYATNASVNLALGAYATNASVNLAFLTNSSLGNLTVSVNTLDSSLNTLLGRHNVTEVSLGLLTTRVSGIESSLGSYATNTSVNLALGAYATNSSVNTALGAYATNASIGLAGFAKTTDVNASLGLYVQKAGDTMTGALSISAGGLNVTNNVSIGGNLFVSNNTTIGGDLTIDGCLYVRNVESIDVSSGFIRLNVGMTGTPPASMQSGIVVQRGALDPYVFMYDESNQTFRIGISAAGAGPSFSDASTQVVATREDSPVSWGIEFFNSSTFRLETSAGFTFTPGTGLGLPIATNQPTELTALTWDGTTVGSRELGSMAFDASSDYVSRVFFDSSIVQIWTKFGYVDTSLLNLGIAIASVSTNKLSSVNNIGVAGQGAIYSYESNNVAYLKKLVQGANITITEDVSTITFTGTATGSVSKFSTTFNPTGISTLLITNASHGLGTGPFTVAVYEALEQIYTGVKYAANGDITLDWTPAAIVADCSVYILG